MNVKNEPSLYRKLLLLKLRNYFFYLQLFLSPDKVKLASKWRLSMCQKKPSDKSKCRIIWHVLYNHSGLALCCSVVGGSATSYSSLELC